MNELTRQIHYGPNDIVRERGLLIELRSLGPRIPSDQIHPVYDPPLVLHLVIYPISPSSGPVPAWTKYQVAERLTYHQQSLGAVRQLRRYCNLSFLAAKGFSDRPSLQSR